jgi:hypothetical protein
MTTAHPNDEILQQYAIEPAGCTAAEEQHISHCSHCQASIVLYRMVFTEVKEQAPPAFEFNIEQLVLPQLPAARKHWPWNIIITGLALAMAIGAAGWWFRGELRFLFNGLMPATVSLVLLVPVVIGVFQAIELFQKYQKLMSSIKE